MKLVLFIILLVLPCSSQPIDTLEPYRKLIRVVERDYNKRQQQYNEIAKAKRYFWKIVDIKDFPFYCVDFEVDSGEIIFVDDYEVFKKNDERLKVLVAVLSYVKRKGIINARVHRMFFYQRNSKEKWYHYKIPIKAAETWSKEGYFICGP